MARRGPGPFKNVEDLEPDDIVRYEGGDEVVDRPSKRSPDGHHWRVWFVGYSRAVVFPPGARFTWVNGGQP